MNVQFISPFVSFQFLYLPTCSGFEGRSLRTIQYKKCYLSTKAYFFSHKNIKNIAKNSIGMFKIITRVGITL